MLAGLQVPFVCSETHELGEELVGSYLYQVHLYHWTESNDYGQLLADNDPLLSGWPRIVTFRRWIQFLRSTGVLSQLQNHLHSER